MKMRTFKFRIVAAGITAATFAGIGCNPGAALNLQDYGRDLLFSGGALAAALAAVGAANNALDAANTAQDTADSALDTAQTAQGTPGAPGAPGQDGADGQNGAQGPAGAAGAQGPAGTNGTNGTNGATGPQGPAGVDGAAGPEFFSQLVDAFVRPVNNVGGPGTENPAVVSPTFAAPVGWKVILSNRYAAGNDVVMRLFIDADFTQEQGRPTQCEQFRLSFVRLASGQPVAVYGGERYILLDIPPNDGQVFLTVDLPLNSAAGLDLPPDLAAGQMLGVGMEWSDPECTIFGRDYRIFGVEFFEAAAGTSELSGASVSTVQPECICGDGGGE